MLVTIVNHNYNDQAIKLAKGLRPYADVLTLDSGSQLAPHQQAFFDIQLPNVYYSGLVNAAYEALQKRTTHTILYFICSDVDFEDYGETIACAQAAFENPQVGVYAPAMNTSGHPQMLRRRNGTLRSVVFVEGVSFAVRASLLTKLCPIDTTVNALGWGLDVYLGFLAMQAGLTSVVDDRVVVYHEANCGYNTAQARDQRDAWFAQHSRAAQRFQKLTSLKPLKSALGVRLLQRMPQV